MGDATSSAKTEVSTIALERGMSAQRVHWHRPVHVVTRRELPAPLQGGGETSRDRLAQGQRLQDSRQKSFWREFSSSSEAAHWQIETRKTETQTGERDHSSLATSDNAEGK